MKEGKYLKQIVLIPIVFSILIALVVLFISNNSFNNIFKKHMHEHKNKYIEISKQSSKQKIQSVFKYIRHIESLFPNNLSKQKELAIKFISDEKNMNKYIFILDVIDINGGEKFARVIVNPNRLDLIDKYLNDSFKGAHGKEFFKEALKEIREDGESFVSYYFKKPDSKEKIRKISYFKYCSKFNWIIGTGIYIDDIEKSISKEGVKEDKRIDAQSFKTIILLISTVLIFSVVLYLIMNKLKRAIKQKDKKIKRNMKDKATSHKQIKYHRNILQTIVNIQKELISDKDFNSSVEHMLKKMINILSVDRVYIFENHLVNNDWVCSQRFEYTKESISPQINNQKLQNLPYSEASIKRWKTVLSANNPIAGLIKDFPKVERDILEPQNIKSIFVMPIFYEDKFWGFIGFDDCTTERVWNILEKDILQIIANSFITALMKDNYSKNLEEKVKLQIKDIRKKDNMLIQQSKMASMGEMIGNIAHQWRQPLNVIGTSVMGLQLKYENDFIDNEYIQNHTNKINTIIQNMSHTIDDFRNFFAPNKEKVDFNIKETIEKTLNLLGGAFKVHDINILINCDKQCMINGYKNEFSQAILVILNNSKDAIVQNNISQGEITIDISCDKDSTKIIIVDNGGGIPNDILDKVFEPYFTTKFKSQGTGIGLYMVKEIVENHMQGFVMIENFKNGVKVTIELAKGNRS
ncbi:MAG: cache domain-containing protein [Arcobacteraceae bacterium]|nr:cache domain-containing protein [Arcobacteraceae bacterium]